MQMISGEKMNELTLELQILAYTDVKRVQPFARMAFTNRSIFLLDQRNLCTLYMDSGKTKNPPRELQKSLDESLLITLSDNGCFIGGITTDGNIFLWDKENDIHRIVSGMPMLASYHDRRFLSDAGLSLPYLCIGDTGFHLLVVNSNFQVFLWEASDINRNNRAYGPDKKLLRKADGKGLLTGSWSLVSQPPEIKLPSYGDHETCIHSVFIQNSSTCGFHCLCSVVFYDSNSNLLVSTLKILFNDRKFSLPGAPKFEAVWKLQSHLLTTILPAGQLQETSQSLKEIGALLIKHSRDGQIIAISLNRASPKSHIVFLSPNHSLFLGRADIQSNAAIGSSNRHHWVVSMEWTSNDLFLVCLTGLGCAHLVTRLGSPVMCLTKDFDFSPSHMRCLPLHPLVSISDGSMVTSSSANSMPQQYSLAVHPNCPIFLCSDGYSVSAVQIMTKHTCLSLLQETSKSTTSFFRFVEKKFSIRLGQKEGLLSEFKDRRLLGVNIPCEPPLRSEVVEVFKFETTPTGLQGDAYLPPVGIGSKSRSANLPDSGKVEFAGIHNEITGDQIKEQSTFNNYLNQLEDRCVFGWTLASSHAGLWTLEHEMVMQGIVENLAKMMHLMIIHGGALILPADQAHSSSPTNARSRDHPLISPDRKFNPGLMRAVALLEKLLKIFKLNCHNIDELKGRNKNASAGSLINCSLLLAHWLVQAVLAGPSKRSKVHALNGCYKIIETTEKNLIEMFLSSSNLFATKVVKAEPCMVFSFNKPDPMLGIEEEEEENETNSNAQVPMDGGSREMEQISEKQDLETTNRNSSESAIERSISSQKKSSLGIMASLAGRKKGADSMDAIIFRRLSSVLPSTVAPPVSIVSRNTLACIISRLCASYRLIYRHACRHLERVANECQDRDPEAIRKQAIGTKRIMSLLVCKMEEMRSHLVPYCVDNFRAKAERRFLDYEQTSAIYTWLNELSELKDGANPGRACRVLHSILYTHLSRYDAFGAIQLVEKVVRTAEAKQICFNSDLSHDEEVGKENAGGGKKSRNAEKRKQLENLQKDVLHLFWSTGSKAPPLSVDSSDDVRSSIKSARPMKLFLNLPSKRLFQTMGRFMARYFVWGCEPFIHPPHQPYSLSPLYENPETVDEERRLVPVRRLLLTKAINLQQFGKVWSPVRALQYLLLSGLFPDAVWYLHNLGNARAAVSVAAVVEHRRSVMKSERNLFKLSLPPCFQTQALLKDMVLELIKGSLKSDSWIEDSSQLQSNFTSAFLASAVCKVDVLTPVMKMMMKAMLELIINQPSGKCASELEWLGLDGNADRRHFFAHPLVNADIKSPLPSVYYPQPAISAMDESRLSRSYLRELRARILLQRIFSLVQVVFSAAGCLKILVSSYSRLVVETSSKVGRSTPSGMLKPYLESDEMSELSDASFSTSNLLSDFRDLCSLMWLMTLRDQLFVVFKEKQKEEHEQMKRSNIAEDLDWLAACRDCVQSCMQMLPFSELLGFASQLNSLLLSSLFELPNGEETASMTARCFPRPEALDPDCRSRLQLKLKEWETAFVSSGSTSSDGSTMAAYYFKHCNSNVSHESGGSSSEQITFPNLIVPATRQESERIIGMNEEERQVPEVDFEPRSFEAKDDYVQFLVDFFEVLLTNKKTGNFPPLVPGNFHKIRNIEFGLLDGKPNVDWMTYQEDDVNYDSRKNQRAIPANIQAPLSGLFNALGRRNPSKSVNEDQRKSLLNLAKLINNRPSKRLNDNNNSNNDINIGGDITGNINDNNNNANDDNDGDDVNGNVAENTGVILTTSQANDNIIADDGMKTRDVPSELQTNVPLMENPNKSKVDFSNKPYLPEEPGNEIRFASHCIQPLIFESMDFGSSYHETERLARWLCAWSDSDTALDKRRTYEKGPSVTGWEDGSPWAAIKVPVQSKLLVYSVWSAERCEIYERIRTEVSTIPVEIQVSEEELEEEVWKVSDDFEIQDASTQSDDIPRIQRKREMADNFNQMSDNEEKDYPQMPSDEATQTELTRNAEDRSKPMTLDAMQLAVKEELRRILEAQNHGILSVLEHLKSSPADRQQELRDLLQVLQVPLQQPSPLQAPSAQMPQAFGVTSEQYTVYALTIETKIEEGLSGNCSRLKDVSKELDHSRMMTDCQPKNIVDSSDITFAGTTKSIDYKVTKIEKESEIANNNVSSNTDNNGNTNDVGCDRIKCSTLQSKLPQIVDVISELKDLIGSHGQVPKVGKLLRLPGNITNSNGNKSKQEQKFSRLISALKSMQLDSFDSSYPIPAVSNQSFSPNFRFPIKLLQNKNNSNNNSNNNNSIDQRKCVDKARLKEPRTPTTDPGLSQDLPLLKIQPHQKKKHLALIKASQATQKQLLQLQEQHATQIHKPQQKSSAHAQLQGQAEQPCQQTDRFFRQSNTDILPCPCLPSPENHVYDSIRKLIHRQVQEHEKRKQFERLQEQTTLKVREKNSLGSCTPAIETLPKKEMEEYDFARLSASPIPKTPRLSSAKKADLPCPTLETLRDKQHSLTPRSHWDPPFEHDLARKAEPFDLQPLREHSLTRPTNVSVKPTNAQLQLLAATGVRPSCCPKSPPKTVPRTSAEDAKKQLERCQEKLEEAKEEIMMLKKALNQELERLDIQKDEPIASQNLNLENAPVELEDVRRGYVSVMEPNIENQELEQLEIQKDEPIVSQILNLENAPVELEDVRGYVSVMEPNVEVQSIRPVENLLLETSFAENQLDVPPIRMVRGNCPEDDLGGLVIQEGMGLKQTSKTAMNEIFFGPTLISSRPQDLMENVDLREAVVMKTHEAARQETFSAPSVVLRGQRESRAMNMENVNAGEIPVGLAPYNEHYPDQAVRVVRPQEGAGVDVIMVPHLPTQQQQDEIMFSPQLVHNSPPLTFTNRDDMPQLRNDTNFHNNLNNDSSNRDNHESGSDNCSDEFPVSPRCLRSLRYGFWAATDMDANVKAIQEMASNIEQDFKSTRLIYKRPNTTPCDKQRPATAPKEIPTATCDETHATIPNFIVRKNLGNLNKMVDSFIPRDKQDNPVFIDCQQRLGSPQDETYTGWMSNAQRAREDKKKKRMIRNMGERCKIAEDLIKGLTEGPGALNKSQSANPRVRSHSSVPVPTFHYDRSNWMKGTELKPHPRSTYVERLQKVTNQPKNHWVFYKCQSHSDRFKARKATDRQVTLKGDRYDFMNPLSSKVKKPIRMAECGSSKPLNANNNTTLLKPSQAQKAVNFVDKVGQLHDDTLLQSEDSLELGADYLDMVDVDDLKSVDSSLVSEIDWSKVDRIVEEEENTID